MKKILLCTLVLLLLTGCGFSKDEDSEPIFDDSELVDENDLENFTDDDFYDSPVSEQPTLTPTPPAETQAPDDYSTDRSSFESSIELEQPLALVDSVEILVLESYPPQYNAVVTGNYRNGCESRGEVTQLVTENTIEVAFGVESQGEICTMALVPFKESIMLETTDLMPGNYTLSVNGVTTQFNVQ